MRFRRAEPAVADGLPGEDLPQAGGPRSSALAEAADAQRERDALLEPSAEQTRYARLLERGTRLGFLCLLITFPLYIFGVAEPHTPVQDVTEYWSLDIGRYCNEARIETGWSWVSMLGRGDFMNFIGIAVLGSVTGLCYAALIPMMVKRRDWIYAVLAVLQVAVLIVAASGIVAGGH